MTPFRRLHTEGTFSSLWDANALSAGFSPHLAALTLQIPTYERRREKLKLCLFSAKQGLGHDAKRTSRLRHVVSVVSGCGARFARPQWSFFDTCRYRRALSSVFRILHSTLSNATLPFHHLDAFGLSASALSFFF